MKVYLRKHKPLVVLWACMIVVIVTVVFAALYTNRTLRSVEKNLPTTLLTEINLLATALEKVSDIVTTTKIAGATQNNSDILELKDKIEIAQTVIIELRDTYVVDNLINASKFHAVIAPALADLKIWLSEGVSGYEPDSQTTISVVELRVVEAYQKAKHLNNQSHIKAQLILDNQRERLEKLQGSVSLLFVMTLLVVCFLVFFLIRQTILMTREIHTKHELREQHDLLQNLLQNIPLGIAVWDKRKNIVHLNNRFTEITGYTEADLPNLMLWPDLAYPDPVYRKYVKEQWQKLDKSNSSEEYKITCKNGEIKEIEFQAAFLSGSRVINTLTDVTERNAREKALMESRIIEARSKKMESLGLLAGGVAHDLNNILSGIVSYPELILLELPEDDKFRKSIELMRDSGQKAAAIVQDLLTVARGVAIAKEPVNINEIIHEYLVSPDLQLLKQYHPETSIDYSLDDNLNNIMGSKVHLRKILMNLVSNGCEAISHTGNVLITTANCHVDSPIVGYEEVEKGDYIVLSVADQGSGIAGKDLDRIFEPFYTKKVMGRSGTGLGLAVVWNVIQDHKGFINVSSSEEGTTFKIFFPVTDISMPTLRGALDINEIEGSGELVLVVDDIDSQRVITSSILEKLNYKVESVPSGEKAVEFLKERNVNLVLLDMIMDPGMNGKETYVKILEINPQQRAIIVSGFAETEEVKQTLDLGASHFLKKPLNIKDLGVAIQDVLRKDN